MLNSPLSAGWQNVLQSLPALVVASAPKPATCNGNAMLDTSSILLFARDLSSALLGFVVDFHVFARQKYYQADASAP